MGTVTVFTLRILIAIALLGSAAVQAVILPLAWNDLAGSPTWLRIALITLAFVAILSLQAIGVCIWILLTKVRRGSVFTESSFRAVNVIIAAIGLASVVTLVFGIFLVPGSAAPGFVALVFGAALVIAGVALVVVVMKALLRQAITREREARALRSELDEVI